MDGMGLVTSPINKKIQNINHHKPIWGGEFLLTKPNTPPYDEPNLETAKFSGSMLIFAGGYKVGPLLIINWLIIPISGVFSPQLRIHFRPFIGVKKPNLSSFFLVVPCQKNSGSMPTSCLRNAYADWKGCLRPPCSSSFYFPSRTKKSSLKNHLLKCGQIKWQTRSLALDFTAPLVVETLGFWPKPDDSSRDPTWSPNVGGHLSNLWVRVTWTHHPKKGTSKIAMNIISHQPWLPWNEGSHFPYSSPPFGGENSVASYFDQISILENKNTKFPPKPKKIMSQKPFRTNEIRRCLEAFWGSPTDLGYRLHMSYPYEASGPWDIKSLKLDFSY